jgi:hypothetical protein
MTTFGEVRRRASLCLTRPVTPEVAGSSPVAPVKVLQIGCCVVSSDAESWPTTQTCVRASPKRSKTAQEPVGGHDFKPFAAAARPTAKAACDYTETAGGQARYTLLTASTFWRRVPHHAGAGLALSVPAMLAAPRGERGSTRLLIPSFGKTRFRCAPICGARGTAAGRSLGWKALGGEPGDVELLGGQLVAGGRVAAAAGLP